MWLLQCIISYNSLITGLPPINFKVSLTVHPQLPEPKLIVKGKMLGIQLVMVLLYCHSGMIGALAQQGNGDACGK